MSCVMKIRTRRGIVSCAATLFLFTIAYCGDIRLRSGDLGIAPGSAVIVDGKPAGTAPCEFSLTMNTRHKIETKAQDGTHQIIYFTSRKAGKSIQTKDVPDWFLDPDLLRPQYPAYDVFASATATSRRIDVGLSKAEEDATTRLIQGKTSVFGTPSNTYGKTLLDSTNSKQYPRLTRGQMDSMAARNGGTIIVTTTSGTVNRTVLQCEIQKFGEQYRVYVLVGKRR